MTTQALLKQPEVVAIPNKVEAMTVATVRNAVNVLSRKHVAPIVAHALALQIAATTAHKATTKATKFSVIQVTQETLQDLATLFGNDSTTVKYVSNQVHRSLVAKVQHEVERRTLRTSTNVATATAKMISGDIATRSHMRKNLFTALIRDGISQATYSASKEHAELAATVEAQRVVIETIIEQIPDHMLRQVLIE